MNSCNFTGRLTKIPEVRKTTNGISVCRFSLAVRRTYKTNGEYKTDFLDFVAWDKTAELIGRYFGQGQLLSIKSMAQTRSYENRRGDRIIAVEFIVSEVESLVPLTQKEEAAEQGVTPSDTASRATSLTEGGYTSGSAEQDEFMDIDDQDLPF